MTQDRFLDYIRDYSSNGEGAVKAKARARQRATMLTIWVLGFVVALIFNHFYFVWIPYTVFMFYFAGREYLY